VKQPEGPPRALLLLDFAGAFRRSELPWMSPTVRKPRTFQDHHPHPPVNTLR
jgi:hypothetical protein